ncbi:unnamed protein product [Linum tenue]|uniref:RING-type E3 ubiquitin transferase n=1 Tax=Linum tenue TaxID=586396 RepID=A0AAV0L2A5_9ROSI|nr:unnamed protein product [Linum tenue]
MASTTNHLSTSLQFTIARRFLHSSPAPAAEPYNSTTDSTFDANVVMVLSVLLCALICSLGLNSIIRCALRCSNNLVAVAADDQSSGAGAAKHANTGIKKKALKTFPTVSFSDQLNLPGLDAECVICLSEFAAGDRVKILPKCNHGFHSKCIDKWLGSHSSCPTCRHCLIETCQKIVGFSPPAPLPAAAVAPVTVVVVAEEVDTGSASSPPPTSTSLPQPSPVPEAAATVAPAAGAVVISMPPLEPEGLVRGYRGDS